MHAITCTTCARHNHFVSAQVTVGRWCDSWRVTEHQSRTFFSGPTPAYPPPLSNIHCIGRVKNWHTQVWLKYFSGSPCLPLKYQFWAYWHVITVRHQGRQGKWTEGRFDTTNAREPVPLAVHNWMNSCSHTSMNSSWNVESRNCGIWYCLLIHELTTHLNIPGKDVFVE